MILQRQLKLPGVLRRAHTLAGPGWRWPALALLALLTGLAGGWLLFGRVPVEGSAEARFARDMASHHDQAVEMALIVRDRTPNEQLRVITLDMMLTQQAQRGMMLGWLEAWELPLTRGAPMNGMGEMMGMATQAQINELKALPVPAAEVAFLNLMIRHHQGGVAMAEEALKQTRRPEVVRMARAIVNAQQSEIAYMQELLKQRGADPAPATQPAPHPHDAHP